MKPMTQSEFQNLGVEPNRGARETGHERDPGLWLEPSQRLRVNEALFERERLIEARELLRGQRWPQEFHDFIEKYYSAETP